MVRFWSVLPERRPVHLLEELSFSTVATRRSTSGLAAVGDGSEAASPVVLRGAVGRWPGGCDDEVAWRTLQVACGDAQLRLRRRYEVRAVGRVGEGALQRAARRT